MMYGLRVLSYTRHRSTEDFFFPGIKYLGNKRGPNNPFNKINQDGFYECNLRGVNKVWDANEMYIEPRTNESILKVTENEQSSSSTSLLYQVLPNFLSSK